MNKKTIANEFSPSTGDVVTTASSTHYRKMIGTLSAGLFLAATLPATAGDADALMTPPTVTEEDCWDFGFSINGWLPSITATTFTGVPIDIGLSEILDNLNMTAQVSMIAQKGRWFVGSDLVYMDLQTAVYDYRRIETIKSDIRMKSWIITPIAGYTLFEGDWGQFDVFGGARYLYLGVDTRTFAFGGPGGTRSLYADKSGDGWAGIVGFRGRIDLSEKWFMPYYFDIGAGDPQITVQAFAGFGYRLNCLDVTLGYRYLNWDLESPAALSSLEVQGPMLGMQFTF